MNIYIYGKENYRLNQKTGKIGRNSQPSFYPPPPPLLFTNTYLKDSAKHISVKKKITQFF